MGSWFNLKATTTQRVNNALLKVVVKSIFSQMDSLREALCVNLNMLKTCYFFRETLKRRMTDKLK